MIIAALIVILISGFNERSTRCSVGALRHNPEGYFWPLDSIHSFVTSADVIVRARADSMTNAPVAAVFDPPTQVHFTVLEALRGAAPSGLTVRGYFVEADDFNRTSVPYRMVRPSGQRGSCLAHEYRKNAEYLMILRTAPNVIPLSVEAAEPRLTPYWAPLAPLNEQIRGDDDPWVQWVRSVLRG